MLNTGEVRGQFTELIPRTDGGWRVGQFSKLSPG